MTQEDAKNFRQNLNMQQIYVDSNNVEKLYLLDQDLYKLLAQVGHSQRAWNVIDSAKLQLDRVRKLTYPMSGYMQSIVDQQQEIVKQLFSGDEWKSLAAMKHHLNEVLKRVEVLIKDFPDYFT